MLWNTSMSPARSGRSRTFSRSTALSRFTASRLMPQSACAAAGRGLGLADELRGRRHHGFGDAGAAGIEQVAEVAQARAHAQQVVLREVGDLLPRAHHADHAADPDPLVGRRRQPRFVAGLQREQQRRAVQRLGFAERHADQRAVGGDGEFEHVALDAVGAGEIALGARRRDAAVAFAFAASCLSPKKWKYSQRGREQRQADRQRREHAAAVPAWPRPTAGWRWRRPAGR